MKNPLRVYEFSNKNKKSLTNSVDIPTADITAWYFYKIHNLFCNRFVWKNLPKEILPWMIESFLFYNGVGVFSVDDVTNIPMFTRVAMGGLPDVYSIPEQRWKYAVNGYMEEADKTNSVLCWDNYLAMPFTKSALIYATELSNIWKTRQLNLYKQRTPLLLKASNDDKLSLQIIQDDIANFVPVIRVKDDFNTSNIDSIDLTAPYIGAELSEEEFRVTSKMLTELGYESNPTTKRERLIAGETQGNNGETEANRNIGLGLRKRCCEQCNKLFGWNIDVKFNTELPTMINGYFNSNGGQKPDKEGDYIE